jgi:TonB family protein
MVGRPHRKRPPRGRRDWSTPGRNRMAAEGPAAVCRGYVVAQRARQERRERGRWATAVLLTLLAHALVLAAVAVENALHPPQHPPTQEPVTLRTVDAQEWERRRGPHAPPEPRPAPEVRRGPATPTPPPPPPRKLSHNDQLVETAPGNQEASPSARFLAEANNHVQRETQARVKTLRPGRPATPPDPPATPPPPAPPPPPPLAVQSPPEHRFPNLIPDVAPLELGPSAQPPPPAVAAPKPSAEDKPGESGGFIDDLSDLATGETTALNTREFRFARWFNAAKAAVARNWHPDRVQAATHHVLDPVSRVTVVRIAIDRAGTVKAIAVAHPCGFDPYDEEAVRAVRLTGAFPDPPEAIFEGRDTVAFDYTFRVDDYWPVPRRR